MATASPVDATAPTAPPPSAPAAPDADSDAPTTPEDNKDQEDDEDKDKDKEDGNARFECNICLDVARDAVISVCGHLFCWPCLHTWMETRPQRPVCPVCKAGIAKEKVIPLYGRGGDNKDPREKAVPPRPRGQRPEPENQAGAGGGFFGPFNGANNNFQLSFGIGAFPFGFFATNFNMGQQGMAGPGVGTAQYEEEQFLHKMFLYVAFAFIFWLLIA